jgi:hypothetical protein
MLLSGALVTSGTIHLDLWVKGYDHVPLIGDLFLLQAALCGLLAVAVLVAHHRRLWVALAGLLAIGTAGGLVAAATIGILGFHDALSAPLAGASLAVEATGALTALAWLALSRSYRAPAGTR